jgi:signal transduction histidine kinase
MKTTIITVLLCLVWHSTFAQTPNPWETKLQAAKTDTAKLRICINAGEAYVAASSKFDSANYFFQNGLSINNKMGTNKLTSLLFLRLGNLKYRLQNYDQAEVYYEQSQQIALQQNDTTTYRKATSNLISITKKRGFYPSAIKQFLAFERTINNKTHRDSVQRYILYDNLGECYNYLEDKQKYYFYIKKQLSYCQTPYDSIRIYQKKFMWSCAYNNSLDTNSYANVKRLAEKLNLFEENLTLTVNLSDYYIRQKQYDKAIETAQTAIKMAGNKPEQEPNKIYAYENISEAYIGKKQYAEALQYQLKMTDYHEKDVRLKYLAYKQLVIIYVGLGNYKKAYEYSNKITAHEEKVKGDRNKQVVAEIEAEMAAMEKQAQLAKSELNAKVQQALFETEQKQKNIVFGLLALSLGLLVWAFWSFQKQKKLGTLLKQEKQKLETKTQELLETNQTKDKIFAVLSHDLKSPIHDLKTILMLFYSKDISTSKMKELMQSLTMKIETVQGIMTNLLQWSLLELKHQPFSAKTVLISPVLEKVVAQLQTTAQQKQITIETILSPVQIEANPEDVEIIIRNVLYNSIKFTPNGGTIRLRVEEQENQIVVICTDTGIGITKNILDEITHHLPTPKVGTAGETGSGLGLRISTELAQRNKGSIRIESEINKGTEVKIGFPKFSMELQPT